MTGPDGVVVSLAHAELSLAVFQAECDLAAAEFRDTLAIALAGSAEPISTMTLDLIARAASPYATALARLDLATRLARAGFDDPEDAS